MGTVIAQLADSHLAPQGDPIDPETGFNARLMDRYRCTRFCIEDSLRRGAEIVLHAGDLLNSPRPTPTEGLLARQALQPAVDAGVPIVLILGNHEAEGAGAHHALEWLRRWPGLTVVDEPCLLDAWRTGQDTLQLCGGGEGPGDDVELQIACLPWLNRKVLLADPAMRKLSPADLNLHMREHVMERLWALAEARVEGIPCVLLAHAAVEEAEMGKGGLGSLSKDWTLRVHDLGALGFDAVLLGHYHKPQRLSEDFPIYYSGSPEAVHFSEEGEEKRYLVWRPEAAGSIGVESVPTPYRRLVTLDAAESFRSSGGLPAETGETCRGAIIRLRIPQAMADRQRELVTELEAAGAFEVKVEIERAETKRRAVAVTAGMSDAEALDAWLEQKPDLKPLREQLHEEAARVEEATAKGGGL